MFGALSSKAPRQSRVDDRRVLSGIVFIDRNGLLWRDTPKESGTHKTLYNRWKRWSEKGVFAQIMIGPADEHFEEKTVMIDASYLIAHPTATSIGVKKGGAWASNRTNQSGINTKLQAVCDSRGRPLSPFVATGQVSDYIGARAPVSSLPKLDWLLGDRGYDADWFREVLQDKRIQPCIPGRKSRAKAVRYDKRRCKHRNRIEIMFGRLNDWRRVATRNDRCPKLFLSAIALAVTITCLL